MYHELPDSERVETTSTGAASLGEAAALFMLNPLLHIERFRFQREGQGPSALD